MTVVTKIAPISRSVRVPATTERAFKVFTASIGKWWPPSYTIGTSPIKEVVVEPRLGGRWYEIGEDGSECQWGDVLAWNPPAGLRLAWRIGMDWKFDPALLTELDITFRDVGGGETEVRIVHSKLESFGDRAEEAAKIFDGWDSVLARYAENVRST